MIRILVVDDHPIVRDGVCDILSLQDDFEIVGRAATGEEAVEMIESSGPDVVLLDLGLPGIDGAEVMRRLTEKGLEIAVVVFTIFDTDDRILSAIKAGARGYLLKSSPKEDIYRAIREVHAGGSLLQPMVASTVLRGIRNQTPSLRLTPREKEALELLGEGLQNKEIADRLDITERTVKYHVSSLMSKLGAGNRTETVTMAISRGLLELPGSE